MTAMKIRSRVMGGGSNLKLCGQRVLLRNQMTLYSGPTLGDLHLLKIVSSHVMDRLCWIIFSSLCISSSVFIGKTFFTHWNYDQPEP